VGPAARAAGRCCDFYLAADMLQVPVNEHAAWQALQALAGRRRYMCQVQLGGNNGQAVFDHLSGSPAAGSSSEGGRVVCCIPMAAEPPARTPSTV